MKLILDNGTRLVTEPEPWKKGGEGNVYKIVSPAKMSNKVVKIYHDFKQKKYDKCVYLKNNPIKTKGNGHQPIVWIDNLVFDEMRNFKGIVMKKADGIDLYALCNQRLRPNIHEYYKKFDFKNPKHFENRLKLCYNICSSVHAAHKQKKYVLADLKAQNILIDTKGFIYIIDTDNIGVIENGRVKFSPEVTSPEISPPEHYAVDDIHEKFTLNWDRFSMAVVLFQVLFGIHPFTGTCESPYQDCNDFPSKIKNQLFPFGPKRDAFRVVPAPLKKFQNIPIPLQNLFLKAFTESYKHRPSTVHWLEVIAGKTMNNLWRFNPKNGTNLPAISTQLQLKLYVPKYNLFHGENFNFVFEHLTEKPYNVGFFVAVNHYLMGRYNIFKLKRRYNRIHSETCYTFEARKFQYRNNVIKLDCIKSKYRKRLLDVKKQAKERLLDLEKKYKNFCIENDELIKKLQEEYADIKEWQTTKNKSKDSTKVVIITNEQLARQSEKERKTKRIIKQANQTFKTLKMKNESIFAFYERNVNRLQEQYEFEKKEFEYELMKIIDQERRWKSEVRHLQDQIIY